MKKQEMDFAVEKHNGMIQTVGRGYVFTPQIHYTGTGTKWFDDTQLIKNCSANVGASGAILDGSTRK